MALDPKPTLHKDPCSSGFMMLDPPQAKLGIMIQLQAIPCTMTSVLSWNFWMPLLTLQTYGPRSCWLTL